MYQHIKKMFNIYLISFTTILLSACGGSSGGDSNSNSNVGSSNLVRFTQDCNLGGLIAQMNAEIEALGDFELIFGSGPNPEITGLAQIGVNYLVAGTIQSPTASYVFNGENLFADVTRLDAIERFRIQWVPTDDGLDFIVNPFGPGPVLTQCTLTSIGRV